MAPFLRRIDEYVANALMVPLRVVMVQERSAEMPQVALTKEDESAQTFGPNGTDKPFRISVQIRTLCRQSNRLHSRVSEKPPHLLGIQWIPIHDDLRLAPEKPILAVGGRSGLPALPRHTPRPVDKIARDLGHPAPRWRASDPGDLNAATLDLNHEEHPIADQTTPRQNLDREDDGQEVLVPASQDGPDPWVAPQ